MELEYITGQQSAVKFVVLGAGRDTPQQQLERIAAIVLAGVAERTQRDYGRALNDFIVWYHLTGQRTFDRACVQAHVRDLKAQGVRASSINQRLAAIRKLAKECAAHGLIDQAAHQGITSIDNEQQRGKRLGNWLTRDQASALLNDPDRDTVKGLRDRAILAVMLGCGLRRSEVQSLTVEHLQQREGRWVIVDMLGKHARVGSIPMAAWVKAIIDQYCTAAGITRGLVFRSMRKGDHLEDKGISGEGVRKVVEAYTHVAPHDLRRTFAQLARKAGATLEQIQLNLRHESIETTMHYIGAELDLVTAPGDMIKLDLA